MMKKILILIIHILLCGFSENKEKSENNMKMITYNKWKSSVLEAIPSDTTHSKKYILENFKMAINSLNEGVFNQLVDSIQKVEGVSKYYILFYVHEGEVCTKVLKFIAVGDMITSVKSVMEAGRISFSNLEKDINSVTINNMESLSTNNNQLFSNILLITSISKDLTTRYVIINNKNDSLVNQLIW